VETEICSNLQTAICIPVHGGKKNKVFSVYEIWYAN